MKFEMKIVPLDRESGKPVFPDNALTVPTSILFDHESFARSLMSASPDGADEEAARARFDVSVFAQVLAEMLGADVYYRQLADSAVVNITAAENSWHYWHREAGHLPTASKYRERRAAVKHAGRIATILETADHRALATDGPVSEPQFAGNELRDLYSAAKAIVKACG